MNETRSKLAMRPDALHIEDLQDLQRSGLSLHTIKAMGCASASADEITQATGVSVRCAGYSIPYTGLKDQTGGAYVRWRLAASPKAMKYLSAKGEDAQLYVPPGFETLLSGDLLIVTEGEKKAAKAVQEGIPCVGLQGVWNWADAAARAVEKGAGLGVSADSEPLPRLLEIAKPYRWVLILGDSDLLDNPGAKSGLIKLEKALLKRRYNVALGFCPPAAKTPEEGGTSSGASKQGLDDWLQSFPPAAVKKALTAMFHAHAIQREDGSEAFVARHFADAHRDELVYSPTRGWMRYLSPHWAPDTTKHRQTLVTDYARQLSYWADELGDLATDACSPWKHLGMDQKPPEVRSWLRAVVSSAEVLEDVHSKLGKRRRIEDILSLAQTSAATDDARWDADGHLLGVKNGVVDLRSGELLKPDPRLQMTRCAGAAYQPLAPCTEWDQFLLRVQPNDDDRRKLHHIAGYCATAETREQVFFISYGEGANGKTTFQSAIKDALGSYADTSQSVLVNAKGDPREQQEVLAQLVGSRFVTITETEQHMELATASLKCLTGEDPSRARALYEDSFSFRPVCKVMIQTNHLPRISDSSFGMDRRLRIIHWPTKIVVPDPALRQRLASEMEGILAWIVRGAMLYYREGLPETERCKSVKRVLLNKADTLQSFLEARTTRDQDGSVQSGVLNRAYCEWMKEEGHRPVSSQEFSRELSLKGYLKDRDARNNVTWVGLRLSEQSSTASKCVDPNATNTDAQVVAPTMLPAQTVGGNLLI